MKLILNSWFRTGSSYTSGYFNGELFDLLEREGHDYLVKVKLKNLDRLMLEQEWSFSDKNKSVCAFEYQAKGWKEIYEYFCYCSNLKDKDGKALHELYKERAESENWIEQTKNQLHASQTLTDDFSANDILWQLAVLGYNLSVMMRLVYQCPGQSCQDSPQSDSQDVTALLACRPMAGF